MLPAAGVAGAGAAAGASSLGLCSIVTSICSALSCAFSACVACFTGARCCSGGACSGKAGESWGPGKVGSILVIVYAVVISMIFEYGIGDKMAFFGTWTATGCEGDACLGQQGVFRVNLAVVAFFLSNWLGCRLSKQYHDSLWIVKVVVFFGYCIGSVFIPAVFIDGWVWVARGGATAFSVLQMVVVVDLAYQVNDYLVEQSNADGWGGSSTSCGLDDSLVMLLCFAGVLFASALAGIVCLFVFFGECATTNAFVALTLVLCVGVTATQLAASDDGNLLASASVCAYGVFVLYTAVSRDPHDRCNPLLHRHGSDWVGVTIGLGLAFVSLLWTTQAAGDVGDVMEDEAQLATELVPSKQDDEERSEKSLGPPPMDCLDGGDRAGARFNIALALVSTYAACTLTNWGTYEHDGDAAAPMAGLITMWLNIAAQWALFLLYEWTLVAPLLFPGRDFS